MKKLKCWECGEVIDPTMDNVVGGGIPPWCKKCEEAFEMKRKEVEDMIGEIGIDKLIRGVRIRRMEKEKKVYCCYFCGKEELKDEASNWEYDFYYKAYICPKCQKKQKERMEKYW